MSRTPEPYILACSLAVAVMFLGGCVPGMSSEIYLEARNERFAELRKAHVVSVPQPPTQSDLAARLGTPAVYLVEDLSLHEYELDYEELKLLHAETLSATGQEDKSGRICEDTADCVLLALLSPILIYDAPFAAIALAFKEGDRAKQVEELTGRLAVFAYDADGNYRWHGCCFGARFIDEFGPNPGLLSYPVKPEAGQPGWPTTYRADYWVLQCHRAKAGDGKFQKRLFDRFNEAVPDPIWTYYWARAMTEAEDRDRPGYFDWVQRAFTDEQLKAGEAFYRAHPLKTIDCRFVASALISAEDAGTRGPIVTPPVQAEMADPRSCAPQCR